jgi:hypothetical protein
MEPMRNEHQEIVGYREPVPDGRVNVRDKHASSAASSRPSYTKSSILTRRANR